MKLSHHFIVFITIFFGFWVDELISEFNIREYIFLADTIPYLIETSIGFLVFCYWVYAIPEKLHSSAALMYGFIIDLCFGSAVGFHMLFFVSISYIIHIYVFRFRIFSYLQLIIFFGSSSVFYLACKYLIFFPVNYSYMLLIFSFFANAAAWLPIYFGMRSFRRTFIK